MKLLWLVIGLVVAFGAFLLIQRRRQPDASQDGDQEVLDALKAAGADLTKATQIDFYLYFPTQLAAEQTAAAFRPEGFSATVRLGADNTNWLCLLRREMVPEHTQLRALRRRFEARAAAENGEYDGWEVAVLR